MKSDDDVQTVVDADKMDKETFARHMTFRHHDSLAGMHELPADLSDYVEGMYRSFHARLHRIHPRQELGHEHEGQTSLWPSSISAGP